MSATRRLLIAATLVNGLLASGNINRGLVDMPAWRQVGVLAWAAFSRQADLGPRAMIVYPGVAFAGMILSVVAAVLFWRDHAAPRAAAFAVYAAALLTIGGLLFTTQAAPIMLSVRHLGDNPVALQQALMDLPTGACGVARVRVPRTWRASGHSSRGRAQVLCDRQRPEACRWIRAARCILQTLTSSWWAPAPPG